MLHCKSYLAYITPIFMVFTCKKDYHVFNILHKSNVKSMKCRIHYMYLVMKSIGFF